MKYKAIKIVRLFAGQIGLTGSQASSRRQYLNPVKVDKTGNGIYEITGPVVFKAGEIIDLAKPDKATSLRIEPLKPPSPEKTEPGKEKGKEKKD